MTPEYWKDVLGYPNTKLALPWEEVSLGVFTRKNLYDLEIATVTLNKIGSSERYGFLWLKRRLVWVYYWTWNIYSYYHVESGECDSFEEAKLAADASLKNRGFKLVPSKFAVMI